ncbi:hypothetical protein EC912_101206 [Luteibacter rhizovicinus]|uniref:Secreted protein n=1 Tax=Luteibacter rhizovicinus TaxID=242606 RepID=A0A4R3YWZ6_9GAMM|nr:hypothetical protein [Luteibacter rhizovicinus]TCV97211.1 hypothetical protein EC912_101206 [Luteibacter rhizovicinus]
MFDIRSRTRLRLPRGVFVLGVLATAQVFCIASATDAGATKPFGGNWGYKQTCGQGHSATVTLTQTGNDVAGDWTDGTRVSGTDGSLKGSIRDGKLFVRYCGGDEQAGYAVCPKYEANESDYFVRQGSDLVWYQMIGKKGENAFRKYVVMHPVVKGKPLPVDTHCAADAN